MNEPMTSNVEGAPAVACSVLLARAQVFHELAQSHRETAAKCDCAELPPEYGDYERGKADAYDVCSDTLKHMAKRANDQAHALRE